MSKVDTETYSWTFVQGSTNISAVSFEPKDPLANFGTLRIRFTSGAEYAYEKVPQQLVEEFFQSESKGGFFHMNIRSNFDGVKIELTDDEIVMTLDSEPSEEQRAAAVAESEEGADLKPLPVPHVERQF